MPDEAMTVSANASARRRRATVPAQVTRTLWGLFFIGGSIFNALVTIQQPEVYRAFSTLTFFGWYRDLLLSVAVPNATAITSLVVILEMAAGVSMLARGAAVRVGLIASGVWVVFLAPAMGWYTLWCPLLLVIPLWLLRYDYDRDIVSAAFRALRR